MISRARLLYLVGLGFTESTAEFLYNKDKCKDLFAGMLIVIAYLFVITIVAESEVSDPPTGMVVGQGPPDQGQLMLLAMITESKRDVDSTNYVVTTGL